MPVFIIHNGREYSDRKIYFVEPTDEELPYFTQLLAEYAQAWPAGIREYGRMHVLGVVAQAEWRTSLCKVMSRFSVASSTRSACLTIDGSTTDFIDDLEYLMHESCADVTAAKTCWSLARVLLPAEWIEQPEFELVQPKQSAPQ